jgi:hypothetical protein
MKHLMIQTVLSLSLSPLALAQTQRATSLPDPQPSSTGAERAQAIKKARTICIHSETAFLTVSTLERALMKQKNWDSLSLNIVGACSADLQIDVDRLHFTHIHTYVLTDRGSGIVLAAGRVRALDGVIASGPMAEQIVKILSAARLPYQTSGGSAGL